MQEENQQTVDMTPEEAKASLGLATRLSEQMLMAQMVQTAPQDAQNAPEQEMGGGMGEGGDMMEKGKEGENKDTGHSDQMEGKMEEKMEILRTELKDTIKMEIEGIRKDIKEALSNEQD